MLLELIRTYNELNPTTSIKQVTILTTLSEVMNAVEISKTLFSEVRTLLQIVHTIPVTSATAERTFSALCCLKTYLLSSMLQSRLNNCMILYVHKEKTDQIDLVSVAKEFITKCERRRLFLVHLILEELFVSIYLVFVATVMHACAVLYIMNHFIVTYT